MNTEKSDDLTDLVEEGKHALNDKAEQTASNIGTQAREAADQVKSDVDQAARPGARPASASNL